MAETLRPEAGDLGPEDSLVYEDQLFPTAYSFLPQSESLTRDLPQVRAVWWHLRQRGVPLPPEAGVILIGGGRR